MTTASTKRSFSCWSVKLLILSFLSVSIVQAQPIVSLTPVISTGLNQPVQMVHAADGTNRVFIVGKTGDIRVYDSSFAFLGTFLTLTGIRTAGEEGLLSMAFHPDYENNGLFFVYYTNSASNLEIARYSVSSNPNLADTASRVTVLTIPHPVNTNHNGGEMHFGSDGFLYLSTGDGGGGGDQPNNAQTNTVLLGKIIRINPSTAAAPPYYSVPTDNPYGNEIFANGLRNPFRWSFDRLTGDMWIGDVGQGNWEEISYRAAASTNGANYGWRCYEGNAPYNTAGCAAQNNYVSPVYVYPNPGSGAAAVTGGVVYRGIQSPALYGYYVAVDFYDNDLYIINPDGNGGFTTNVQAITPSVSNIGDFGEMENGEILAVSVAGAVYRITAVNGAPVPVTLANFGATVLNKQVQLQWKTSSELNIELFDIEYSLDGNSFAYAGTVQAQNAPAGAAYNFLHVSNADGFIFYRLKMKDVNGKLSYSGIIKVEIKGSRALVSPSVISNGVIQINLPAEAFYSQVEVISSHGAVLIKKDIEGQTGRVQLSAAEFLPGIYMVRFIDKRNEVSIQKIVVE